MLDPEPPPQQAPAAPVQTRRRPSITVTLDVQRVSLALEALREWVPIIERRGHTLATLGNRRALQCAVALGDIQAALVAALIWQRPTDTPEGGDA